MDIIDEVKIIGPGHKRRADSLRIGYWTPEIAWWSDESGYVEKQNLVYSYRDDTGNIFHTENCVPSPMIGILTDNVGHLPLEVTVEYAVGSPNENLSIDYNGVTIVGYSKNHQYGEDVYRREWLTSQSYSGTINFDYDTQNTGSWYRAAFWVSGTTEVAQEIGRHTNVIAWMPTKAQSGFSLGGAGNMDYFDDALFGAPAGTFRFGDGSLESGAFEWWFRATALDQTGETVHLNAEFQFNCLSTNAVDNVFDFKIETGVWLRNTTIGTSTFVKITGAPTWENNEYYHMRVDWRSSAGNAWADLEPGKWKLTVRQASQLYELGPWDMITDDAVCMMNLGMTRSSVNVTGYCDAMGYSFDPSYTMGDNLLPSAGETFEEVISIPAHEKKGTIFQLSSKRMVSIDNITVSPHDTDQPVNKLTFYALTDNGSRLLHTFNWNKPFDYMRKALFGMFGHPRLCDRCDGTGYIGTVNNLCDQCSGYQYAGWNASGSMGDALGKDIGITRDTTLNDQDFRNKIWTQTWHVTPTAKEIKRFYAHFAQVSENNVEIIVNQRSAGTTGIESIVSLTIPYMLPLARFSNTDNIWTQMAKSIEPAGILINFSLLPDSFTGLIPFEELSSVYMSGYVSGELTGQIFDRHQFGFHDAGFRMDHAANGFYDSWGGDWFFFNMLTSGHASGDDALSGYGRSGATYISGGIEGGEWVRWAWPSGGNTLGGVWHSGVAPDVVQQSLWDSGVYYWDNFYASGGNDTGIIY